MQLLLSPLPSWIARIILAFRKCNADCHISKFENKTPILMVKTA